MGFRSTFVSSDIGPANWPEWFKVKYEKRVFFGGQCLASKGEGATYKTWENLEDDIQKCLPEVGLRRIELIYFHECGGITKVIITTESVTFMEPTEWGVVPDITHHYCHDCAEPNQRED